MVKHSLQGKLQRHSTFVVACAKYGVVDLDRAVCLAERPRLLLTVVGRTAHGIRFAAVGTLYPVHVLGQEAALGIQPQHVVVIARKQQSSCAGLHPRVAFAARGRNSVSAVVRRLDLAPPNLHVTVCEVAILSRVPPVTANAKFPMVKGYQELSQQRFRCALCQDNGIIIGDEALHMLPRCQLTKGHGRMEHHPVVDIGPVSGSVLWLYRLNPNFWPQTVIYRKSVLALVDGGDKEDKNVRRVPSHQSRVLEYKDTYG